MKEFMKHFPKRIGKEIEKFALDEVFYHGRYIFTTREGNQQYGYCTYCRKTFKTAGLKHKKDEICPQCGSTCEVHHAGRGRNYMVDDAYFVYYSKSVIDPEVVIARGFLAVRDHRGDYRQVKTEILETARYLFKKGESALFTRWGYYSCAGSFNYGKNWERRSRIFSMFNQQYVQNKRFQYESINNVMQAIKGTPFEHCTIDQYSRYNQCFAVFLGLYSKYPCIEYLTKLGFKGLVHDKLFGFPTYSSINWRGKSLQSVLKLTSKDLKEIKETGYELTPFALRVYQISKKDGSNYSFKEIDDLISSSFIQPHVITLLKKLNIQLKRIIRYSGKQLELDKTRERPCYYSNHMIFHDYEDYIADCRRLNLDLTKESVLFPKDLHKAHQNTIKQIKIKGNKLLNAKIKQIAKEIDVKYAFQKYGLFIRAAASIKELINEGKALNHCVGVYADWYASGKMSLLFIRENASPDVPYFTVEIKNNVIIQSRGKNNCAPDKKVEKFLKAFTEAKLSAPKKTKIKIPA
ncbi:MAG: hypothetical protein GX808_03905 [Syntrophomonadaceae bacterium]|nr:hypothetical protein [Syntrophomonadaceae bacterium]